MYRLCFVLLWFNLSMPINGFIDTELALSFFTAKNLKYNTVLTCCNRKEQFKLSRHLTLKEPGMLLSVKSIKSLNILDALVTNYKKVGVILDGDCADAKDLLMRCKRYKVFDSKHFWLVMHSSSNYHHIFQNANLNVDSDIKIAYPSGDGSEFGAPKYIIDDVYNPAYERGGDLKSSEVGFYDINQGYQTNDFQNKYFARKNLTGVKFKTVVVIPESLEGSVDNYLDNDRNIEINTLNRFHARLINYCKNYYNFSMDLTVDKSWGYLLPDGTMDGLVGGLERKKVDFGLTPLLVKKDRAQFIRYGRKTWNLRAAFILRNPKSRKSYQIFVKPLSFQVWSCIVVSSILSVLTQQLGYGLDRALEKKYSESKTVDTSWSFSTVCTFGAFCQQGIIAYPSSLSGRTAALVTLLLGLLIYQFYSASLVSFLLNVPTTTISNVRSILDNDYKIGCEDVLIDKDFLKYTTDSALQEVYRRLQSKNQSGFLDPEVGLNLVKKGQYAFHVQLVTGYPILERTFDETTICELKEVLMWDSVRAMHANYQQESPIKDIMDVCLQRFSENGVLVRELIFWHPRKPECVRSSSTININTGLIDFYPALAVLFFGMVLCLHILAIEILWYHRSRRSGVKETPFEYVN